MGDEMTAAEALDQFAALQAENLALRMENTKLEGWNKSQANTIKVCWVRGAAKDRLIERLRDENYGLRTRNEQLEAKQSPKGRAEKAFKI